MPEVKNTNCDKCVDAIGMLKDLMMKKRDEINKNERITDQQEMHQMLERKRKERRNKLKSQDRKIKTVKISFDFKDSKQKNTSDQTKILEKYPKTLIRQEEKAKKQKDEGRRKKNQSEDASIPEEYDEKNKQKKKSNKDSKMNLYGNSKKKEGFKKESPGKVATK